LTLTEHRRERVIRLVTRFTASSGDDQTREAFDAKPRVPETSMRVRHGAFQITLPALSKRASCGGCGPSMLGEKLGASIV